MKKLRTNDMFINHPISSEEFREIIWQSRVILDTQNTLQDGMTARFMWAIGLGKKVITTNESIFKYDIFNSHQIFVINNNYDDVIDFVKSPFIMSDDQKALLDRYRIDNWIDTMLSA